MGSGSSVKAKPVPEDNVCSSDSVKSLSLPPLPQTPSLTSQQSDSNSPEVQQNERKYEKLYMDMEKEMGALEVANMDMQDKIEILEQQITYQQNVNSRLSNIMEEEPYCPESLKAKDVTIKQLEEDVDKLQQDMKKLRIRCKKRIRAANIKVAEAEQCKSLELYEFKNEMAQLKENNKKLTAELQEYEESSRPKTAASRDQENPQSRVIISLSTRISKQEARIIELENNVHERDKIIEQMKRDEHKLQRSVKTDESNMQQQKSSVEVKGAKKKWSGDAETDFRGSSGISRDSGIVQNESSRFGDNFSKLNCRINDLPSDDSDKWESEKEELERDTPLNIRQISAMKKRHRKKGQQLTVSSDKTEFPDADDLIKSIDQSSVFPSLSQVSS